MDINEIISEDRPIAQIIADLKDKTTPVPLWEELEEYYDPKKHEIITNPALRPRDKRKKNGQIDRAARILYPAEKIVTRRMNQMCFTIPVERKYETEDDETLKEIANAIEAIYEKVRINGVNKTGCVHISGPARYVLYGMQLKRRTKTMVSSASISSNAGAILPCRPKCRKSAKRNCGRFSTSMMIWWQCASSTPSQKETDNVLFRLLYEGHVQELFQQKRPLYGCRNRNQTYPHR